MKKSIYSLCIAFLLLGITHHSQAQSLKDLLNSKVVKEVANKLVEGDSLTFKSFAGEWLYEKPACSLQSGNLLKEIGGKAVTTELEKKIAQMAEKAGLVQGKFSIVFNNDSTFYNKIGEKELKGKYGYDPATKILTMTYSIVYAKIPITSVEAKVEKSGENISLLFNATKWKDYLQTVTSIANASSLNAINSLLQGYDGIGVGYELKKKK